jgi:type I restriction enzyme, S subunit
VAKESNAAVPRLQFPEFRGASDWTEARLEDLITAIAPPAKLQSSSYRFSGRFPIVDQSQQAICGWTDDATAVVKVPLPLIVFGDHTCALRLVQQPFAQGADGIKILKAKAAVSTEYLFHSLSHRPLAMEDYKRHFSMLKERRVFYPDIKTGEQQKIAECLTSLDELIAAQGRKVEALKKHKRGLMQPLFACEGETLPRLRYLEFRDAPEWEEAQLGGLFDTTSGGTPDRAKKEYWSGTIPWVTTSLVDFNVITKAHEFISEAGLENSSAKLLPQGTVLIAMYGQGKTRGKVAMLGIAAATNQACAAILPNDKVDQRFTFASLCSRYEEMRALSNSGGQENLSQGLIRGLPFRYPKDVGEQSKIVGCLSALDFAITAESEKLEALKIHKRGLMQQLFPSPVEV